jgi:hypothetical protein
MQQLVLQFSPWGSDTRDFDNLISLEQQLIDALAGKASVDGHDMGSNEANIFIYTPDAGKTFSDAFLVVQRAGLVTILGAAFREVAAEKYTRLWPEGSMTAFSIT